MTRGANERDGSEVPLRVLRRGGGPNDLSFDDVFALLAARRRRLAVHYLSRTEGAATVAGIAERISAWERGGGSASDDRARRVERDLRDRHLPALIEANVATVDGRSGDVRYLGHPVVDEFVEHVAPVDLPE